MGLSLSAGVTTGGACVRTTSIDLFQLTYAPLLAKPGPCRSLQRCLPVRLLPSAQRSPANDQPTNFIAIQRSPRGIALNSALSLRHYIRVYIRVCMYVRVDLAARSAEKLSIPRYHHSSSSDWYDSIIEIWNVM